MDYPVNITVSLAGNDRTVGKMYIDLMSDKWTEKLLLQPHMQPLSGGQSYSSSHTIGFPINNVTSVSVMWFKKKFAFGSNTLQVRQVVLEPQYVSSVYDRRMLTKMFCGHVVPTAGKSEYPISLSVNCRPW